MHLQYVWECPSHWARWFVWVYFGLGARYVRWMKHLHLMSLGDEENLLFGSTQKMILMKKGMTPLLAVLVVPVELAELRELVGRPTHSWER